MPLDEDTLHFRSVNTVHAAELNSSEDEDLSQLDSGPPCLNNLPSHSTWSDEPDPTILTTSTCKKRPKKKKTAQEQDALHELAQCRQDILFGSRPPTSWVGLRDTGTALEETAAQAQERGESPTHRLPDFFGPKAIFHGFHLVGYAASGSRPIVDSIGTVCGVFGDRPPDADFMEKIHDPAVEAMEEARANCSVSEEQGSNRSPQVFPGALVNGVINTAVLVALLSNIAFIRYAGFATGLLATWALNLFDFYVDCMRVFYKHYPHLHRPFNLGPWTCALGHRDYTNLDCKLIIEFPPGTTILILSAAIFHSNIPISDNERCDSFTQYTAGGPFQWIENGFQLSEAYLASLSKKEREEEESLGKLRAKYGVGLLSTVAELEALY
ncbi:hypothetical protein B0H17DRAFT_1211427 [Mycena rosella]|uniref:Uncharacterized protein n=1 Tax=Mycena rosella TaxID=1033263 RepID=A0AAD7CVB2_MYCRO|nr:hypothetical protein B0H17DRAFT_1211427 [Mycena rosella]